MNTAIAILAAGSATRFGSPKQLAVYKGQSLVSRAVQVALGALGGRNAPDMRSGPNGNVCVILGAYQEEISEHLAETGVHLLRNDQFHEGIASSIRCAVDWAESMGSDGLLMMPCDQILISIDDLANLIAASQGGQLITAASYEDTFGIPAYFPVKLFPELKRLSGDRGAKGVIANHPDERMLVAIANAALDIDTLQDLQCKL